MDAKPKRRRSYQFSLRTFFLLVTIACVGFGYWVHRSKEWIRQRHEVTKENWVTMQLSFNWLKEGARRPIAPGGLWLFGEVGVSSILVLRCGPGDIPRIERLFPEAVVTDDSHR